MSGVKLSRARFLARRTVVRVPDADAMGHRWQDEGTLEFGGARRRCTRCHACAHWPLAEQPCAAIHISSEYVPASKNQDRKRLKPVATVCKVCGADVVRIYARGEYCGIPCADTAARRQRAEYKHRRREAKRAAKATVAA